METNIKESIESCIARHAALGGHVSELEHYEAEVASCKAAAARLEADTDTEPAELVKLRREAADRLEACQITHTRKAAELERERASLLALVKATMSQARYEVNRLAAEREAHVKAAIGAIIGEEQAKAFLANKEVEALAGKAAGVEDRRRLANLMGRLDALGQMPGVELGNAVSALRRALPLLNPEPQKEQP